MAALNLPQKRLIVFAGMAGAMPRMVSLRNCQAEAVMFSYLKAVESKNEDKKVREFLQTWPTLKLLDSGVFTFMRATGTLRAKVKEKGNSKGHGKVTVQDLEDYADGYISYLKQYLDYWDFVVELDVDNLGMALSDGSDPMAGVELADKFRIRLREVTGDKLIPVWHTVAGLDKWKYFFSNFPYIGTGSDRPMDETYYRRIINEAHAAGAKVHGFGGTRLDVMTRVPYDTADSTTWLASVRYGQFGGINFRAKSGEGKHKGMTPLEITRLREFRQIVEEEYDTDPEELLRTGGLQPKYELAIQLFQKRQAKLPPIEAVARYTPALPIEVL